MNQLVGLLLVVVGLAAVIGAEVASGPSGDGAPPSTRLTIAASPASPPAVTHYDDWVSTVRTRPLFSPDRRPLPEVITSSDSGISGLPRLTGIIIGPYGRSAIFAAEGSKPIVLQEGGRLGAYMVKSINVAEVRLIGPDGARILSPTFDRSVNQTPQAPSTRRVSQAPPPR